MAVDQIRIIARPQLNPQKCDFEVDRPVLAGSAYFGDAASAAGSPLPEKLFALDGVRSVLIRGNVVIVTKDPAAEWAVLAKEIGARIRAQLQSGEPVVGGAAAAAKPDDDAIRDRVQEVLDRDINPSVASHGGAIELLDVQSGVVYIRMMGGCQGCASSTATLRQGVEVAVRSAVPEVVDILDVTDHAAGANPYYAH